jgi:hypothetical protein
MCLDSGVSWCKHASRSWCPVPWNTVHTPRDAGCVRPTWPRRAVGRPCALCRSTSCDASPATARARWITGEVNLSVPSRPSLLVARRARLAQAAPAMESDGEVWLRRSHLDSGRTACPRSPRPSRPDDQAVLWRGEGARLSALTPTRCWGLPHAWGDRRGGAVAQRPNLEKSLSGPLQGPSGPIVVNQRMLEMERRVTPVPPARPLYTTLTL